MPESFGSSRPYPGKLFRLKDAAEGGYLIKVHCNLCRTTTYYLGSDLVELANPERPAHPIPFPCSRCETTEFMSAKPQFPAAGDWGSLPVRRPGPVKQVGRWRTVNLGD